MEPLRRWVASAALSGVNVFPNLAEDWSATNSAVSDTGSLLLSGCDNAPKLTGETSPSSKRSLDGMIHKTAFAC